MKSIAVIGLDRFGITLATTLAQLGHQVLCIDNEEYTIQSIARLSQMQFALIQPAKRHCVPQT